MAVTMRSQAPSTGRSELSLPLRTLVWTLLSVPLLLSAVGLLMIYSSTRTRLASEGSSELHFVYRQGAGIAIGIVVMALATVIDYRRIRDFVVLLYLVTIPTLVAVLVVGSNRRGTQAWFQIGPLQLQPSELAKVVLVLTLAAYCAQHRGELDAWRLGAAITLAAIPFGLVMLQPDLGTAMVLGVSTIAILLVAGIRAQHFAILVLVGLTLVATAVATGQLEEYQVDRLTGFLGADDSNLTGQAEEVYNLNQSKIAIASGQLTGKGLFEGTQTQLGFVPEQHTDFIFTAVGEELGFLGGATVLLLLAILVWRMWRAAALASDFFGSLLCIGFLAMFAFQAFENIGMTMGIMPITGIPLPFVSYAPSATIAMFAAVGLVANVHSRRFS
jgi:rod shape determining protein RodA